MAKRRSPNSRSTKPKVQPVEPVIAPSQPYDGAAEGGQKQALPSVQEVLRDSIPVLPYQDRWIMDDSQLKVAVWSRQSGKSYAAALRAVMKCLSGRTQYIILSKGERQSRLFMEKAKDFCIALKRIKVLREFRELPETDDKTMEVYFPHNGSRIIGLPANPDTARGYSGNIVLDEFAFHGDARKIYAACFPIITRGYSIEVISTPNGTAGKFYEIAKAAGLVGLHTVDGRRQTGETPDSPGDPLSTVYRMPSTSLWSGHRVDIYDAVRQGLPAKLDLLRSGCDDEETWLQEYCCQFLSDAQNYISIELISSCVHEEATTEWVGVTRGAAHGESRPRPCESGHELYLGVDIGRKRDLTIAWLFEKVGGVLWSRRLLTLKGVSFDEQEKAVCRLIEGCSGDLRSPDGGQRPPLQAGAAVRRCCVDQSGMGMMLAEHLVQKYGEIVEAVQFTAPLKERLAPMVKQAFEDRTLRIPDNREVRADINAVKRFVTPAGNVRFDAEHTDRGHADRFWALAMVVNAAATPRCSFSEQAYLTGAPVMRGFAGVVL